MRRAACVLLAVVLAACSGGTDRDGGGGDVDGRVDPDTVGGDVAGGDGAASEADELGGDAADGAGDGDAGATDDGPPWLPATCPPAVTPDCDGVAHELPIPTHFSASLEGFSFLAADQPALFLPAGLPGDYAMGGCYPSYAYGLVPAVDDYPADDYAALAPSDTEALDWADALCVASGFPVRHLHPPRPDGALAGAGPTSRACELQVVHAAHAGASLFTVFLPPGWDGAAPPGTYPILFNGAYDLNENVMGGNGASLGALVADSVREGGRGVIGVLWNGGGAYASRTMSEHSLLLFAQVIAEVAERYRGNPQWVVTFGISRGGVTALRTAANPNGHPYRVVASVAVVPATLIGEHARLGSVTYPPLLHAMGWTTGLQDAWRYAWSYPACAGRPDLTGLSRWQAHLAVLTGTSHPDVADEQHSLAGARYLDALEASGVQLYLGIGEHDFICPYAHQVALGLALLQRQVPAQIEVLIRGGHSGLPTRLGGAAEPYSLDARMLEEISWQLSRPTLDLGGPVPTLVTPGVRYHRVDRATGETEVFSPVAGYPFSVDLPYVAIAGQSFPAVVVGEPGTAYEVTATEDATTTVAFRVQGVIPNTMRQTTWVALPAAQATGTYTWSATLTRVGGGVVSIPATATTTGAPCTTTVLASEPALDYASAATGAEPPTVAGYGGTNWGLSEY